jgi:large subunit ribosomal protein L32e
MVIKKFVRTDWRKYSKLGHGRKKKIKYRRGKGIDNKMRKKMKGNPRNISIGFRTENKSRDLVKGLKPIRVFNLEDLKKVKQNEIGIIAKVGNKKRKELVEYASENNININLNPQKVLSKIENKIKEKKLEQQKRKSRKIEKDKKAKKEAEKKAKEEAKKEAKEKQDANKEEPDKKEEIKKQDKSLENKMTKKNEIKTNNYGRGK